VFEHSTNEQFFVSPTTAAATTKIKINHAKGSVRY
jgi:hypothetical protein